MIKAQFEYMQGLDSYKTRVDVTTNPYGTGSLEEVEKHRAWFNGWCNGHYAYLQMLEEELELHKTT